MMSKQNPSRIPISLGEVEEHLVDQLEFLRKSSSDYDGGETREYKRLALALRVLLHSTRTSQSVVQQLNWNNLEFFSGSTGVHPDNELPDFGLVALTITDKREWKWVPTNLGAGDQMRKVHFEQWWTGPVLKDGKNHEFSRKEIVLSVADQDGGAHVDPTLNEAYHDFSRSNSMSFHAGDSGWGSYAVFTPPGDTVSQGDIDITEVERAAVRQIAHEALMTLDATWARALGNRRCQCGSGRKYRYCHGKVSK